MAYELKFCGIEITKDGEPFFKSGEQVYSNLDYAGVVLIQGVLLEAQSKLADYAKEQVKKGKK